MKVYALLRAGKDDRSIAPIDPAIVALAAVQALNAETEAENEGLRMKLEALKRQNAGARRPRLPSGEAPDDG